MSLSIGRAAGGGTRVGPACAPSGTSTSTETGTATVTMLLCWKRPVWLSSPMFSGASVVCHRPSGGRVLRNSALSEMRRQTRTSTFAVVSTVCVAANAPSAPPDGDRPDQRRDDRPLQGSPPNHGERIADGDSE